MNRNVRTPESIDHSEPSEPAVPAEPLADEERFTEPEWLEWFALTPRQRWAESEKLWAHYLEVGGRLDPEPDTQSPFFDASASGKEPGDGWTGLRVVRRGGV
jgi:hypothetical protein